MMATQAQQARAKAQTSMKGSQGRVLALNAHTGITDAQGGASGKYPRSAVYIPSIPELLYGNQLWTRKVDMTNAERQKRYRAKKSNVPGVAVMTKDPKTVTEAGQKVRSVTESDWPTEKGQEILGNLLSQLDTPVRDLVDIEKVLGKCYSRPAVACEEFGTRPMPLAIHDKPVPHNRGRYTHPTGSVYQFDCMGTAFECKYPFVDKYGDKLMAVYETASDVQECFLGE